MAIFYLPISKSSNLQHRQLLCNHIIFTPPLHRNLSVIPGCLWPFYIHESQNLRIFNIASSCILTFILYPLRLLPLMISGCLWPFFICQSQNLRILDIISSCINIFILYPLHLLPLMISGCLWPFYIFLWFIIGSLDAFGLFSSDGQNLHPGLLGFFLSQPLSLTHNLSLLPILSTSSTSSNLLQDLLEEGISGSGRDWWLVGWRDRMVKKVQFGTGPQQQLLLNSSTFNLTAFIANSYLAISIHATLLRQLLARSLSALLSKLTHLKVH